MEKDEVAPVFVRLTGDLALAAAEAALSRGPKAAATELLIELADREPSDVLETSGV